MTYAVDGAADWGWFSPDTLGLIAAGLILLGLFVLRERSAHFPLVDLSLFRNRPYVGVTLLGTVANVSFVCATFGATLYLQTVAGIHPGRGRCDLPGGSLPEVFGSALEALDAEATYFVSEDGMRTGLRSRWRTRPAYRLRASPFS